MTLNKKLNICIFLCESINNKSNNISFNNVFDTIELSEQEKASFNLILSTNILGDETYRIYILMKYLCNEKGELVNKYRFLDSFESPRTSKSKEDCIRKNSFPGDYKSTNGMNILNFDNFGFPGLGVFEIEVYAIPKDEIGEKLNSRQLNESQVRTLVKREKNLQSSFGFEVVSN